jgi:hypothetical protein
MRFSDFVFMKFNRVLLAVEPEFGIYLFFYALPQAKLYIYILIYLLFTTIQWSSVKSKGNYLNHFKTKSLFRKYSSKT